MKLIDNSSNIKNKEEIIYLGSYIEESIKCMRFLKSHKYKIGNAEIILREKRVSIDFKKSEDKELFTYQYLHALYRTEYERSKRTLACVLYKDKVTFYLTIYILDINDIYFERMKKTKFNLEKYIEKINIGYFIKVIDYFVVKYGLKYLIFVEDPDNFFSYKKKIMYSLLKNIDYEFLEIDGEELYAINCNYFYLNKE